MRYIGITECEIMKDDEIDANRYLDCADYDHCLGQAVKLNMRGFTCKGCYAFEEFKKAQALDTNYEIEALGGTIVVKKFNFNTIDLNDKNIGTLWND